MSIQYFICCWNNIVLGSFTRKCVSFIDSASLNYFAFATGYGPCAWACVASWLPHGTSSGHQDPQQPAGYSLLWGWDNWRGRTWWITLYFCFVKVGVIFSLNTFTQAFTNRRAHSGILTTATSVFSWRFLPSYSGNTEDWTLVVSLS